MNIRIAIFEAICDAFDRNDRLTITRLAADLNRSLATIHYHVSILRVHGYVSNVGLDPLKDKSMSSAIALIGRYKPSPLSSSSSERMKILRSLDHVVDTLGDCPGGIPQIETAYSVLMDLREWVADHVQ